MISRVCDARGGRIRDLIDHQFRGLPFAVRVDGQRQHIIVGDREHAEARRARDGRARIVHEVGDEIACGIIRQRRRAI